MSSKPRVIILTSSPLTDRILLYTDFVQRLAEDCLVEIWAASYPGEHWERIQGIAEVLRMPPSNSFPEIPTNFLRRVNDIAWAYSSKNPSKLSMMRHLRDPRGTVAYRCQKALAWLIARAGMQRGLDRILRKHIARTCTSPAAEAELNRRGPAFLLSMGPHFHPQMLLVNAAVRCGVPIGAYITSWDNMTTKTRLDHCYSAYFVWNEDMKKELLAEECADADSVFVTGAPQFDILTRQYGLLERAAACRRWGLRPELPIILYAMGRANGVDERFAALELAQRVSRGDVGQVQLLVRPHPYFEDRDVAAQIESLGPSVRVQRLHGGSLERQLRPVCEEDIVEWVNCFYHASVVVHLSSTAAIDAAILGRPSVCLNYDPEPEKVKEALIKEVNCQWLHYRRVTESGGTWLVNNSDELVRAIQEYLRNPERNAKERVHMALRVAGFLDGLNATRFAAAVAGSVHRSRKAGRGRVGGAKH